MYAKESIQIKRGLWLHVTCVDDWLKTTCDPEAHEETEWNDFVDRFSRWFMRASKTPEVMIAHRALQCHFGQPYSDALRIISAQH
jgi:hypothetical protein